MAYTKDINRTLKVCDNGQGLITLVQENLETDYPGRDSDIVILDEEEAIEVYRFLHNRFGGQ